MHSHSLHGAILDYFAAERRQMSMIVAGASVLSALAIFLFYRTRDPMSRAFMWTVLISAAMLAGIAVTLIVRNSHDALRLTAPSQPAAHASQLAAELARMEAVVAHYAADRYLAAGIGCLALCALLWPGRGQVDGVAAGLLLLVVAQVLIDHYSEAHARGYVAVLSGHVARAAHGGGV